jgi:hypothetical protein
MIEAAVIEQRSGAEKMEAMELLHRKDSPILRLARENS